MISTMSGRFTGSVSLAQESTNSVPCCWGFTFKQLCEAQVMTITSKLSFLS